jgi:hypothetical protein
LAQIFRDKVEYELQYRIVLPDGTVRHLHSIGHPVLDQAGQLVEYFGSVLDVTERKCAEQRLIAQHRVAGAARWTRAARGRPAEDDGVAWRDAGDAGSNRSHHARAFMTEHEWRGRRPVATSHVQIAVAHAGGLDLDQDLVVAGRVELHALDGQRRALRPQNGRIDVH